jgi:hypothetical protein
MPFRMNWFLAALERMLVKGHGIWGCGGTVQDLMIVKNNIIFF